MSGAEASSLTLSLVEEDASDVATVRMPFSTDKARRERFARQWARLASFRENRAAPEWRDCAQVEALLRGEAGKRLRQRRVIRYDANVYPLQDAFAEALGVTPEELSTIHTAWSSFSLESSHFADKAALLRPLTEPHVRARLQEVYDRLMLEVVVPDAASVIPGTPANMLKRGDVVGCDDGCSAVLYQAFPCVRVQQPCNFATIRPHTDDMYHHPRGTLNYYAPLVPLITGGRTLQLEAASGTSFVPLELRHGELGRFAGAMDAHFTIANDTGLCRVSLDMRAVPAQLYDPLSPTLLVPETGKPAYAIGDYYSLAERGEDGAWRKTVAGRVSERMGFPFVNSNYNNRRGGPIVAGA
eukprot:scaffold298500_cov33-Tisochrysis_lutea.AAC.1